jgi:dihydroorotate dehydrogenase electron transfer subunit
MAAIQESAARIVANEQLTERLWLVTVEVGEMAAAVQPGQFVHMLIPGMEGHVLRRPFSVFYVDAQAGTLTILYQAVGFGSQHLTTVQPGALASIMGPIGHGWNAPEGTKNALLVAGGVGGAPLFMHAQELVEAGVNVEVVLGAQTAEALVCEPRYTQLLGQEPHLATDDGTRGHAGFVTTVVERLVAEKQFDYVAICGPEPMMRIVSGIALEAGLPTFVSLEKRMACGIGACLSCIVETVDGRKRSCVDGPVFDASKVVW